MGLFATMLPIVGFVLGMPARRGTSSIGIALGLVAIAEFIRISGAIQGQQIIKPAMATGLFMLFWVVVTGSLFWLHSTYGAGFLERACAQFLDGFRPIYRHIKKGMRNFAFERRIR